MSQSLPSAKKKLLKLYNEFKKEDRDDVKGFIAAPDEKDIYTWHCVITGPENTIWADGFFKLDLTFTDDYPSTPPSAKFNPPIYHPNVYRDGRLCLDILTPKAWDRNFKMSSILLSIQSLLNDPNPESPANKEANKAFLAYTNDESNDEYKKKVRECVEKSWESFPEEES
ncbi:Ubiquitin-conjugating enzyme E2 2 [Tritrichomonas musculus]|uniref:Ubiquitin-conjugating enzyme E2 2 n=1 Tax=Tritrichomonas musculus TaxID=1915356 RepID=A0ABR2IXP1_9EUKA